MSEPTEPFSLDEKKTFLLALLQASPTTPTLVDALVNAVYAGIPNSIDFVGKVRLSGRSYDDYKHELETLLSSRRPNTFPQMHFQSPASHAGAGQAPSRSSQTLSSYLRPIAPKESPPTPFSTSSFPTSTTVPDPPITKPKRGRPPKNTANQRHSATTPARGSQRKAKRARHESGPPETQVQTPELASPSRMSTSASPSLALSARAGPYTSPYPFQSREPPQPLGLAIQPPKITRPPPAQLNSPSPYTSGYLSPGGYGGPRVPVSESRPFNNFQQSTYTPPGPSHTLPHPHYHPQSAPSRQLPPPEASPSSPPPRLTNPLPPPSDRYQNPEPNPPNRPDESMDQ